MRVIFLLVFICVAVPTAANAQFHTCESSVTAEQWRSLPVPADYEAPPAPGGVIEVKHACPKGKGRITMRMLVVATRSEMCGRKPEPLAFEEVDFPKRRENAVECGAGTRLVRTMVWDWLEKGTPTWGGKETAVCVPDRRIRELRAQKAECFKKQKEFCKKNPRYCK